MEIYGQPWNWYVRVGHNSLNCEMTRMDGVWLLGPAAEGHRFVLLRRRMLCSPQQLPVPNTWLPFKSPRPRLPVPPDLFFTFHIVLSFASSVLSNPNPYTNMETRISAVPTALAYGAARYRRAWGSFVGRTPCWSERLPTVELPSSGHLIFFFCWAWAIRIESHLVQRFRTKFFEWVPPLMRDVLRVFQVEEGPT